MYHGNDSISYICEEPLTSAVKVDNSMLLQRTLDITTVFVTKDFAVKSNFLL